MSSLQDREGALVATLLAEADAAREQGDAEQALALRYRALGLAPSRLEILRGAAVDHERLGDERAASACRVATVPEAPDRRFYLADLIAGRLVETHPSAEHRPVEPAAPMALPEPVRGGREELLPPFRRPRTVPLPDHVDVLDNGSVWFDGFNTLAMTVDRQCLERQARGNIALAYAAAAARPLQRLSGTACLLDARSGPLYYHWLLDVLPKLGLIEHAGFALQDIDHFIVRNDAGYARDTLAHLGIPAGRVLRIGGPVHVSAERMIVPFLKNDVGERPSSALGLGMNPWVPRWLRERFVPPSDRPRSTSQPPTERLYISRASRGARSVADEAALREGLLGRGFTVLEAEGLSVPEQAAAMDRADVIVAPHGGGLANLAFCRPGTRVVELFGGYVVPCYWALCALAGLRYAHYLSCDHVPGTVDRDAAIPLQVEPFLEWLDAHLAP